MNFFDCSSDYYMPKEEKGYKTFKLGDIIHNSENDYLRSFDFDS